MQCTCVSHETEAAYGVGSCLNQCSIDLFNSCDGEAQYLFCQYVTYFNPFRGCFFCLYPVIVFTNENSMLCSIRK